MTSNIIEKIKKYQSEGFLFHGSPESDIKSLEPRHGFDDDQTNTFNNDTGVFAIDLSAFAIMFSLTRQIRNYHDIFPSYEWSIDVDKNNSVTSKLPQEWKNYIDNFKGYLYILDSKDFTENLDHQWKSKKSVIPIDKIDVNLEDYFAIGGKIEWSKLKS